jgi:hypothetical protein
VLQAHLAHDDLGASQAQCDLLVADLDGTTIGLPQQIVDAVGDDVDDLQLQRLLLREVEVDARTAAGEDLDLASREGNEVEREQADDRRQEDAT